MGIPDNNANTYKVKGGVHILNILFITHHYPNYVPDLLLHGLRKILGPGVVDYPRKDCLYNGVLGLGVCPEDQLAPDWFPADSRDIDRTDIWLKLEKGFFNYVICDVRALDFLRSHLPQPPESLAIIDGEDFPTNIQPGNHIVFRRETDGSDYSIPLPMAVPEEIFNWIVQYDHVPKEFSIGFLGSTHDGVRKKIADAISDIYDKTLFSTSAVPSNGNPNPDGRFSRDEYYQHLQKCRIVLSLSGAGHDTFRFWENASCNAAHLSYDFPLFIPHNFIDGEHILRFTKIHELRKKIDRILNNENKYKDLIAGGRYHLAKHHFTDKRAVYFIDRLRRACSQHL